ncbi:MAG: FtsX-like permease family protein [Acidimicrobiales bacterium]
MTLLKLTFKNFLANKWRFLLTLIAVTLGVTFTIAVFVFTDSMRATFDDLSGDIQSGFDLAVRSEIQFGDRIESAPVPVDVQAQIAGIPGVAAAQPRIFELNVIAIQANGEAATTNGPPNIGLNWETETAARVLFVAEGRPPEAPGEISMDIAAAEEGDFIVGDSYNVLTPHGTAEFELVGTFSFADPEETALVGAKLIAFETQDAVALLNNGEGYDDIVVELADGADLDLVTEKIAQALPDGLEVVTQEVIVDEQTAEFDEVIAIFQTVLLTFAFIILIVSAFIIYNTFTILIGQRIREFGLLRALGASGGQITRSVILEAFIVGIIATVLGIIFGYALAIFLRWLLAALEFGPEGFGLPLNPATFLYGIFVGIGITVVSAVSPAIKARKVSPMAALRDDVRLQTDNTKHRPKLGAGLVVLGLLVAAVGIAGEWQGLLVLAPVGAGLISAGAKRIDRNLSRFVLLAVGIIYLLLSATVDFGTGRTLVLLGAGAVVTFLGVNKVSPMLARPVASLVGRVPTSLVVGILGIGAGLLTVISIKGALTSLPGSLPLLIPAAFCAMAAWLALDTVPAGFRVTGRLARENASRNPYRTASTAAALMIGLALVTSASIVGSSLKASFSDVLQDAVVADWFITPPGNGDPSQSFSSEVAITMGTLPEIEEVAAFRYSTEAFSITKTVDGETSEDTFDGRATDLTATDRHMFLGYLDRDDSLIGPNAILLHEDFAEDRHLEVGSTFPVGFNDGSVEQLTVAGVYSDNALLGDRVVDLDLWNRKFTSTTDQFVSAIAADGFSEEEVRAALQSAIGLSYPQLNIETVDEYRDSIASTIDDLLLIINVLLGLAVVIALVGVTNTLALSVFERTRELGLVRAVGMTAQQVRRMVRFEGVIVSIFGGLLGVGLGLVLGVIAVQVIPDSFVSQLDIPYGQLLIYIFLAAMAGLFAAALPARRASKLNVLDAISHQ